MIDWLLWLGHHHIASKLVHDVTEPDRYRLIFILARLELSRNTESIKIKELRCLVGSDRKYFSTKYRTEQEGNMNEWRWGSYFSDLIFNINLIFIRKQERILFLHIFYTVGSWKPRAKPDQIVQQCPAIWEYQLHSATTASYLQQHSAGWLAPRSWFWR